MVKSYCVKEKKETGCVAGSEKYSITKNLRIMMKCKCTTPAPDCGITKTKFVREKDAPKELVKQLNLLKNKNKPKTTNGTKKGN